MRKKKQGRKKKGEHPVKLLFSFIVQPVSLLILLCLTGIGFIYFSGLYHKTMDMVSAFLTHINADTGLVLQNVYIEGQHNVPTKDILHILEKQNVKIGQPLLTISLDAIKEDFEHLSWIKYVAIERQFPNTLSIHFIEKTPVALWQNNNQLYLIDDEGKIITGANVGPFSELIILVGSDAPANAKYLLKVIGQEKEILQKIASAIRVGERRWNIRLKNGTEIRLPEEGMEEAWQKIINKQKETAILDNGLQYIDLKIKDRIFVKE